MDLSHPYRAVVPSLDGDVLDVLYRAKLGMTGRQVALLTGRSSHSGVLRVLNRLVDHGLVHRVELNRAALFSLNRDHLAFDAVAALSSLSLALRANLSDEIAQWDIRPVHASIFGSAARGDGDTASDIDIFLVRPGALSREEPIWQAQVDELRSDTKRWTGNEASISELSYEELIGMSANPPPVMEGLRSDAILLAGASLSELIAR